LFFPSKFQLQFYLFILWIAIREYSQESRSHYWCRFYSSNPAEIVELLENEEIGILLNFKISYIYIYLLFHL